MEENNMQDNSITLNDIFRILKKNLILLISITAAVFVLGMIYTLVIVKPTYKATTSVIVAIDKGPGSIGTDIDYTNSLKIVETVATYATDKAVLEPVAEAHNIQWESLYKMVSTSTSNTKYIFTISVVNKDSNLAAALANEICDSLEEQTGINDAIKVFNVTVRQTSTVDKAAYNSPNKTLYLLVSLVLGVVLGVAVIFVIELLSNKYKDRKEIEATIGEDVIGLLFDNKKNKIDNDVHLVQNDLKSLEPYNKIATNIKYSNLDNPYKSILFTSTIMDELKSTVCVNLAYSLVLNKKKVCLIDLDLRKPCVHKAFNVQKENGLVDYLDGTMEKDEIIKHTDTGIDVITIGQKVLNPLVVLESKKLKDLIEELKSEYDYVLLDSAPVIATDSFVAAKLADGIVYNVAMNHAKKKDIQESIRSLKNLGIKIIGLVITKAYKEKKDEYYYYSSEK